MKRSQIDKYIEEAAAFFAARGFHLPPWSGRTPAQWAAAGPEADEVRSARLGWDVTDLGSGDFPAVGLVLFTIRNGPPAGGPDAKDYCEKAMMVRPGQVTPYHFHHSKMEDIINRAGGRLVIRLYHADERDGLDPATPVSVQVDGITRRFPPGGELVLTPGESVTLPPRLYHSFWGRQGDGPVLVGEVSRVNDDQTDNRFLTPMPRFPGIEEDRPARFCLCTEYPPARGR